MNEIETMREALDRTERNLERFRWVIGNPQVARAALDAALSKPSVTMQDVVFEIDRFRSTLGGHRRL